MAQPATNPKIEELRFKLKTDPKSRLFYQLAEELRKAGHLDEAEQILHNGLQVYPTYLAAWVSLGRVLRDKKNDGGAVDALNKALQLDPGNVVAARILADAYLALGEKVEAIKKYKLVLALLPTDEELKHTVAQLDRELRPVEVEAVQEPEPAPPVLDSGSEDAAASAAEDAAVPPVFEESPFDKTIPPFALEEAVATADVEPMAREHDQSPFEEPVSNFTSATMDIEAPSGFHVDPAPLAAEVPAPVVEEEIFDTAIEPPAAQSEDFTNTLTMADLYVNQGLVEDARHIYENILARDPENADVRARLAALAPRINPKVAQLERWLAKVSRREVGRV
ncbi:MAG TPA: tetratricopeptide repeat protein [Thermoanaerobaculia bacterium]|nr:tetratricopeptide repeat protein [Thermoanaerobaculia bacterium]